MTRHQPRTMELDRTMLVIIQALSRSASQTANRSVNQLLKISESFLSDEAHRSLIEFHELYFGHSHLSEQVNAEVDQIFEEALMVANGTPAPKVQPVTPKATDQASNSRIALSALQKKLEAMITMEEQFRESVKPVLSSIRFEDAMSQRLNRLDLIWSKIIDHVTQSKQDLGELSREIYALLDDDAEHHEFEDEIKKLNHDAADISFFLKRIISFSKKMLGMSAAESEEEVLRIQKSLELLMNDVKRRASLTQDAFNSLNQLQSQVTEQYENFGQKNLNKLLQILHRFSDENQEMRQLLIPVIEVLQFQDKLRQNLENLGRMLEKWLEHREKVLASKRTTKKQIQAMGSDFLKCATTIEERNIIRSKISGLPKEIYQVDDILLF